jgi:hypothetical protein
MAILGKIIKETYLIDAAIPNSHNLHSTITEKLQMYTDLKEDFTRIWKLTTAYIICLHNITSSIDNGKYSKQITRKFKTAYLRSGLYITMQKAV